MGDYFCKDAETFVRVLDFLENTGLVKCPQRFRVIRYLLANADKNGIVRTTYQKVTEDLGGIEMNTVGFTFRHLMKTGLISMTKTNMFGKPALTEYIIDRKKLREIVRSV